MKPHESVATRSSRQAPSSWLVRKLLLLHLVALGPALLLGLALTSWAAPYSPAATRAQALRRTKERAARHGASGGGATTTARVVEDAHGFLQVGATRRELASGSGSSGGSAGSGSGGGGGSGSGGHAHHLPAPMLAVFATIALGGVIMQVFSRFNVPYTVILLGLGMLVGAALVLAPPSDGLEGVGGLSVRAAQVWAELDAHLLLHIFLPPLIFESAFAMEWRVFNQAKWFCAFLAGPCMLAATYATGSLANWLLLPAEGTGRAELPASITADATGASTACAPDAWSREAGYMLGVVLSATNMHPCMYTHTPCMYTRVYPHVYGMCAACMRRWS